MTEAARRLARALLAGMVCVASVSQVGCGVLHCVAAAEAPEESASKMPCHGTPPPAENDAPAEHDKSGACCLEQPVEFAGPAVAIDPVVFVAVALNSAPVLSASVVTFVPTEFFETGPDPSSRGATLPLRI